MRTESLHVAAHHPRRSRPRITRVVLAAGVVAALGASGIYIATANAGVREVAVPGRLQAEAFSAQSGSQTESTGDTDGGKNVGWLGNGDWLRYDNVTVGGTVTARIASDNKAGGFIDLRTGSPNGTLLASIPVTSTGGWQKWVTKQVTVATPPAGKQRLFAVIRGARKSDFVNINWFTLGATAAPEPTATPSPGPTATSPSPRPVPTTTAAPTTAAPTTAAPTTAAPTAAPTTGPTTTPPQTGNGWVVMDQTKWRAQLAKFKAMTPRPIVNNPERVAEFHAACTISHRLPDDPIVFPNMPGASHMHSFFGNKSLDAATTPESLLANKASSCKPDDDHSAYWVPTLYENDKVVDPHGVTVYYGSRLKDTTRTVPFPQGFRMIVGNAKDQTDTPKGAHAQFWCAGAGGEVGRSSDGNWPVCARTAELTFHLTFPDCWDGVHLDSPDHKSHVGPADSSGRCSGKFPVAIPSVAFVIGYPTSGSTAGFRLSSGKPRSMHGDAFMMWEDDALGHRVMDCIVQMAKCNVNGGF